MSTSEESAGARAITAILQAKTGTASLPFSDRLTWVRQEPAAQISGSTTNKLRIGHTQQDGNAVFAHYIESTVRNKTHYHEDGGLEEIHRGDFMTVSFEVPFRYIMEEPLGWGDKVTILGAYVKACYCMEGWTTGSAAFRATKHFKSAFSRAINILVKKKNEGRAMTSSEPEAPQTSIHVGEPRELVIRSMTQNASSATNHPETEARARRRPQISSSSSQASEDNTVDFDDNGNNASYSQRHTRNSTTNSGSASRLGMFSPAKPRTRSRQHSILDRANNSEINMPSLKRKSLGMFSNVVPVKRANMKSNEGKNDSDTHPDFTTPVHENESLFIPEVSPMGQLNQSSDEALSSLGTPSPGMSLYQTPTEERNKNHQMASPSPYQYFGPNDYQNKNNELETESQAQEYLSKEASIEQSIIEIRNLQEDIRSHKLTYSALKDRFQTTKTHEEDEKINIKKQAEKQKDDVRKRVEAELAALIKEVDDKMNADIEGVENHGVEALEKIENQKRLIKEKEDKIKEDVRALEKMREKLTAMENAGGFTLGSVVSLKKAQRKED